MKLYSYNFEIRSITAQVLDVFNNMIIKRYSDPSGQSGTTTLHQVPCVYGSRSGVIKSLENANKTLAPPILAVTFNNLSRDTARVHSVNSLLEFQTGTSKNIIHNVATPVNLTYELTIVTKYRADVAQIISNFVAIFNPDIYVTFPNPKGQGNLKTQIIWDGDVSIEYPNEVAETDPERIIGTASFTVKSWIFPGSTTYSDDDVPTIEKINFSHSYGVGPDPSYQIGLSGEGFGLSGGYVSPENAYNKWYEVPYSMSFDSFYENVLSGYVQYPNYDYLPDLPELSGSYWLNNIYGQLSGDIYSFNNNDDLLTLIENVDNPDLDLTLLFDDGYYYSIGTYFEPEILIDLRDWDSIWRRMLSGDLSFETIETSATSNYQYIMKEDDYLYLMYEDYTIIPIIT